MFEYFVTIKKDKLNTNDFDPAHVVESLNRTKLFFHRFIIRLIDNVCVRNIYNTERRFDLVYCIKNEAYNNYLIFNDIGQR
jgi:hypothetical protein